MQLGLPNRPDDVTEYKYECVVSCRPKKFALEELLKQWPTYEDNFENLKFAGNIIVKDMKEPIKEDENNKITMFDVDDPLQLVAVNKKKVRIVHVGAEEVIKNIYVDTKRIYGVEPQTVLYGMMRSGGPIMAFVVGSKIISQYGFCIEYDAAAKSVTRLVDLTKL